MKWLSLMVVLAAGVVQAAPPPGAVSPVPPAAAPGAARWAPIEDLWPTIDGSPDTSTLAAVVRDVVKPGMTNEEKAVALWWYVSQTIFYYDYMPGEPFATDPVRFLNVYGWSLCGKHNNAFVAVCHAAGFDGRMVGMNNHTSCEIFYDGAWHWLDANRGDMQRMADGHVGSLEEIKAAMPDRYQRITRGECDPSVRFAGPIPLDRIGLTLRRGERVTWNNGHGEEFWFPGQRKERFLAQAFGTGQWHYEADFTQPETMGELRWGTGVRYDPAQKGLAAAPAAAGQAVLPIESPYLFAKATLKVEGLHLGLPKQGTMNLRVSVDHGLTWVPVGGKLSAATALDRPSDFQYQFDLTPVAAGYFDLLLRFDLDPGVVVRAATFDGVFHHGRAVLPMVHLGANVVRVRSAATAEQLRQAGVVYGITYAVDGQGQTIRRGIAASPAAFGFDIQGRTQPRVQAIWLSRGLETVDAAEVVTRGDLPPAPETPRTATIIDTPAVLPPGGRALLGAAPAPPETTTDPDGTTQVWVRGISSLPAVKVAKGPVIDGKLDDPVWQQAACASNFSVNFGGAAARLPSALWVMRDDKYIYVGIFGQEPAMKNLRTTINRDDGKVYMDDDFEVFLAPGRGSVYQMSCNALGLRYDGKGNGGGWNGAWLVATQCYRDGWTAELALPIQDYVAGGGGTGTTAAIPEVWGFSVCRTRIAKSGTPTETSAWACPFGGFYSPRNFGNLLLKDSPIFLADLTVRNISGGSVDIAGSVRLYAAADKDLKTPLQQRPISAKLEAGKSLAVLAEPWAKLAPGSYVVVAKVQPSETGAAGPELEERFFLTVTAPRKEASK